MPTFSMFPGGSMGQFILWLAACASDDLLNPRGSTDAAHDPDRPAAIIDAPRAADVSFPPRWMLPRPLAHATPVTKTTDDGELLFASDTVQELSIELSDASVASLRTDPREEVDGTLIWRGVRFEGAVRLKGSASFRTIDQKPSFKIDVHAIDAERRIDGLKRLTLNNMVQDPSMMREHMYYWLAARLGIPAPRQAYAHLTVNGADYGLYSLIEPMDGRILDRLYPDDEDGNLYESSGADFTYARSWFELQQDGGVVAAPDDVRALVDALETASDAGFYDTFRARFDADEALAYLALDTVAGNDDGYVYNHHNFFTYHLAVADRWTLLPWGTDRAFTRDVPPLGDLGTPAVGVLALRCWADADCAADLTERIEQVLSVWERDLPERVAATKALIADPCDDDPRRESSCDPAELTEFVQQRPSNLRTSLE